MERPRPLAYRLPRNTTGHLTGSFNPRGGLRQKETTLVTKIPNYPPRIQTPTAKKVFLGGPSETELRRGDVILQIGNKDTQKLTHQEAHNLIKNAGNQLSLTIQRLQGGGARSPLPKTPTGFHPLSGGVHPLASPAPPPSVSTPISPGPPSQDTMNRSYPSSTTQGSSLFHTLPTTNFADNYRPYAPEPHALALAELQEFAQDDTREKQAIVHQAYRTLPLITPKVKTKHDLPMGSYLRHVHDPNWNTHPPGANPLSSISAMRKIQEAAVIANTPVYTPVNPIPQDQNPSQPVYHQQYNSPINIYSAQAVAETLAGQTRGLQPSQPYPSQSQPSPRPYNVASKSHLAQPERPTPQPFNVNDITQSPTYRMIHEKEAKDHGKEHQPVSHVVYDISAWQAENPVNAFGVPKGKILQSGSFRTIMSTLGQRQP